jgi:sulfite reductase (NADPH) flavoprotein alpha-component
MAGDVEKAMIEIAATQGGLGERDAKALVADLKKSGRYQADVY